MILMMGLSRLQEVSIDDRAAKRVASSEKDYETHFLSNMFSGFRSQ